MPSLSLFQSTPSGGKATSPRLQTDRLSCVSIHAFRGEGDDEAEMIDTLNQLFQSTPSGGKATRARKHREYDIRVSIHAFRGEGDFFDLYRVWSHWQFQSTPSGGKATLVNLEQRIHRRCFNPRLPGGRRPTRRERRAGRRAGFNPRLPGGRRPPSSYQGSNSGQFQSTPSGGKATNQ